MWYVILYTHVYALVIRKLVDTHLNLPSLSERSDDLHVRSTENFSKFTLRMRQWMVMPIWCVCVCARVDCTLVCNAQHASRLL